MIKVAVQQSPEQQDMAKQAAERSRKELGELSLSDPANPRCGIAQALLPSSPSAPAAAPGEAAAAAAAAAAASPAAAAAPPPAAGEAAPSPAAAPAAPPDAAPVTRPDAAQMLAAISGGAWFTHEPKPLDASAQRSVSGAWFTNQPQPISLPSAYDPSDTEAQAVVTLAPPPVMQPMSPATDTLPQAHCAAPVVQPQPDSGTSWAASVCDPQTQNGGSVSQIQAISPATATLPQQASPTSSALVPQSQPPSQATVPPQPQITSPSGALGSPQTTISPPQPQAKSPSSDLVTQPKAAAPFKFAKKQKQSPAASRSTTRSTRPVTASANFANQQQTAAQLSNSSWAAAEQSGDPQLRRLADLNQQCAVRAD